MQEEQSPNPAPSSPPTRSNETTPAPQPNPVAAEAPKKHTLLKILLAIGAVILALILGYLFVYWWVFNDLSSIFSMSALKGQVVSNEEINDVQDQLLALGIEVEDNELFQLDSPSSTNYAASAIKGFKPEKIKEIPQDFKNAYYFYDKNRNPFFLRVDDNNKIDPDSLIPLIVD